MLAICVTLVAQLHLLHLQATFHALTRPCLIPTTWAGIVVDNLILIALGLTFRIISQFLLGGSAISLTDFLLLQIDKLDADAFRQARLVVSLRLRLYFRLGMALPTHIHLHIPKPLPEILRSILPVIVLARISHMALF